MLQRASVDGPVLVGNYVSPETLLVGTDIVARNFIDVK